MTRDEPESTPESTAAAASATVRFEAPGAIARPTWIWIAFPIALSVWAAAILNHGQHLGVVVQFAALTLLGLGIVRRPRTKRAATIRVDGDRVMADAQTLTRVPDVVGVNVLPWGTRQIVTLSLRDGRSIEVLLGSEREVAELRAVIGLPRDASRAFSAHTPIGVFGFILTVLVTLALVRATSMVDLPPAALEYLIPFVLMAFPFAFAAIKRATVTCGDEGVLVRRLASRRLIRYDELGGVRHLRGEIVRVETESDRRQHLDLELGSVEQARRFCETLRQRRGTATGPSDGDVALRLARGHEDAAAWLARVRVSADDPQTDHYRSGFIAEERLWDVLEDPSADASARVGAGVALRLRAASEDEVARSQTRIRVAAGTTALPEVRDALLHLADRDAPVEAVAEAFVTRAGSRLAR
ncbi:MAG: hypothetical protein AB7S26_42535 [Sandaracinaceae bacterium]